MGDESGRLVKYYSEDGVRHKDFYVNTKSGIIYMVKSMGGTTYKFSTSQKTIGKARKVAFKKLQEKLQGRPRRSKVDKWLSNRGFKSEHEISIPKELKYLKTVLKRFSVRKADNFIYFLFKEDKVVYVGQTKSMHHRIVQHINSGKDFDDVFYLKGWKDHIIQAMAESGFIKLLRPPLNKEKCKDQELTPIERRLIEEIADLNTVNTGGPSAK